MADLVDLMDLVDPMDLVDLLDLMDLVDPVDLINLMDLMDLVDMVDLIDLVDLVDPMDLVDVDWTFWIWVFTVLESPQTTPSWSHDALRQGHVTGRGQIRVICTSASTRALGCCASLRGFHGDWSCGALIWTASPAATGGIAPSAAAPEPRPGRRSVSTAAAPGRHPGPGDPG